MSKEKLIKKIKKGLKKSGFPLEMKISNILLDNNWSCGMNDLFYDFETGKYRESDIHSMKTVRGTNIHLFIECKKSDSKQMLLYCPKNLKKKEEKGLELLFSTWVKHFPAINILEKDTITPFLDLELFDSSIPWAKNIIFSKGDYIEQDNISFFSSLNGLLKRSIERSLDGYLQTGCRTIFFYFVIWDGLMFEIKKSKKENFVLNEIDYGQYEFEYNFQLSKDISNRLYSYENYKNVTDKLRNKFIIEIIKPNKLEEKIKNIEKFFEENDEKLKNWGKKW